VFVQHRFDCAFPGRLVYDVVLDEDGSVGGCGYLTPGGSMSLMTVSRVQPSRAF
jgi:hypothetical protein